MTVAAGATVTATTTGNWTATSSTRNQGSEAADFTIAVASTHTVDLTSATAGAAEGYSITSTGTGAITGSSGNDIIVDSSGVQDIKGLAGDDAITLTAGVDSTVVLSATTSGGIDTITAFTTTDHTIDILASGVAGSAGANLGSGNYGENAIGSLTQGTAYDVMVLTGASYATVALAEDAVAARMTSATKGYVIFADSDDSTAKMYYDADLAADNNLTSTATVLIFNGVAAHGNMAAFFGITDFDLV